MIDAPFIQRAHAIVAQARALGLLCAADATQAGAQAAGALS
jgi:hypothetical protein